MIAAPALVTFGSGEAEPLPAAVVGSKAANLMRLARLGAPVPPGFVLSTATCRDFLASGGATHEQVRALLAEGVAWLEEESGLGFGAPRRPLVVAVRSGAPVSMPGMLDTVLDVGLDEDVVRGLLRRTGNPRLAWDSYRRLIECFARVVYGCPPEPFESQLEDRLRAAGASSAAELDSGTLAALAKANLHLFSAVADVAFPRLPHEQLLAAVMAVFRSWNSKRARDYRRLHGLSDELGTAVIVQRMVFGNAGSASGSGVAFSRDPSTGEPGVYLDFAPGSQGEDVVSGRLPVQGAEDLRALLPGVYAELQALLPRLERELGDLQEVELTVEESRLWVLQTRAGKRTPRAALRVAVDLADAGVITPDEALQRMRDVDLDAVTHAELLTEGATPIACGLPASLGVAVGGAVFDPARAAVLAASGQPVILVRHHLSPDDLPGIAGSSGILTAIGGRTSHAAVVARELGKVCIVACPELRIAASGDRATLAGQSLREGDVLSLDGNTGAVYTGELPVRHQRPTALLARLDAWRQAATAGASSR